MEIYFQLCCIPRKVAFPFQADSIPIRGGGGYLPWEWKLFLHELPISTTFYYISFFTSTFFNFLIKYNSIDLECFILKFHFDNIYNILMQILSCVLLK